jgi:hypothetical protein
MVPVSSCLAETGGRECEMTTGDLSRAVDGVAFMIRGEPRAVQLRYLYGLLDLLSEWADTHPEDANADPWVNAVHHLVSTIVLNADADSEPVNRSAQ